MGGPVAPEGATREVQEAQVGGLHHLQEELRGLSRFFFRVRPIKEGGALMFELRMKSLGMTAPFWPKKENSPQLVE